MKLVIDTEWQNKMARGEAQYCGRCGGDRWEARGTQCVGGKRHIWAWTLKEGK